MFEFFRNLFQTSDFPARWNSGNWTELHGWVHIVSDLGTFGAYVTIPLVLIYFITKRKDVPLPWIFWLFCIFIFLCGTVHLVEAIIFWVPVYRLSGALKFTTALASWSTVLVMIPSLPKALSLPGVDKLNETLQQDIVKRERAAELSRRQLEEANIRLQEKSEEMEQLVYTISHDLKSPVVTCRGFLGVLKEKLQKGEYDGIDDIVHRLENGVSRLNMCIEDLLNLSRAGTIPTEPKFIDADVVMRDIINHLTPQAQKAGADIYIDGRLPTVYADPRRLMDVFDNLLSNAIKYGVTELQKKIVIGAAELPDEIRMYVRDNGPGVNPAYHEKIFGVFETLTADKEGTGMGLTIVRKVMDSHGGRVWIESNENQGACFWIAFPKHSHGDATELKAET